MASFILTQHVVMRARERFRWLRDIAPELLRGILEAVAGSGELIPSVVTTHELRRAYLVRVTGGVVEVATLPSRGAEEIIVAVDHEDDGGHIVTVFDKTMDLPEAEVDHPRKYSAIRRRA